jgi:hypothetical protein
MRRFNAIPDDYRSSEQLISDSMYFSILENEFSNYGFGLSYPSNDGNDFYTPAQPKPTKKSTFG